jgi:hypothetical protein
MRYAWILLVLTGCGFSSDYQQMKHDEQIARFQQTCQKLGVPPGPPMQDCVVKMRATSY